MVLPFDCVRCACRTEIQIFNMLIVFPNKLPKLLLMNDIRAQTSETKIPTRSTKIWIYWNKNRDSVSVQRSLLLLSNFNFISAVDGRWIDFDVIIFVLVSRVFIFRFQSIARWCVVWCNVCTTSIRFPWCIFRFSHRLNWILCRFMRFMPLILWDELSS